MTPKRIYVAGPMYGYADLNYPAFYAAAEKLRAAGWLVENPVDIAQRFGGVGALEKCDAILLNERLEKLKLATVASCNAIYLLRGWEKSRVAHAELRAAIDNRLEIILEPSP